VSKDRYKSGMRGNLVNGLLLNLIKNRADKTIRFINFATAIFGNHYLFIKPNKSEDHQLSNPLYQRHGVVVCNN